MSLNYITSININMQIFNEDFVNYTPMFNKAKLIINYNGSKTKDSINNILNVKTVEWNKQKLNNIKYFLLYKSYVDYYTWTKY